MTITPLEQAQREDRLRDIRECLAGERDKFVQLEKHEITKDQFKAFLAELIYNYIDINCAYKHVVQGIVQSNVFKVVMEFKQHTDAKIDVDRMVGETLSTFDKEKNNGQEVVDKLLAWHKKLRDI